MDKIRTLSGIILSILGIGLVILPFFVGKLGFIAWIYGIPLLIIGLYILFNKTEDQIEKIRTKGGKHE